MPKGPADDIKSAVNNLAWKSPLGQINNTLTNLEAKSKKPTAKVKRKRAWPKPSPKVTSND